MLDKIFPVSVFKPAAVETGAYAAEANRAFPLSKEEF
jgi:hypothetical protein